MALVAPSNLVAASGGANKINLSWTNPDTYDDIFVQRSPTGAGSWVQIAVLIATAHNYQDQSCQDGTRYYYRLSCQRDDPPEFEYSNTASAITQLPAPSGLTGYSSAAGTQVTLEYIDNSANESGFRIYQDGVLVATLGANITSHAITGLTQGKLYSFKAKAYNAIATSADSNILEILTADPPAKPTELIATTKSTTEIDLAWKDNADNETKNKVERSTDGINFAQIALLGPNITAYADTGRTSNTKYWYRVRAYNSSGDSSYSNIADTTTLADIAAPSNLVVKRISDDTNDIHFDDNSNLEDCHCLERKNGTLAAWNEIVQLEPNRTAYRDTGLDPSISYYYYRVRAKQGAATYSAYDSPVGEEKFIRYMLDDPDSPSGLTVSEYQDTWARISWNDLHPEDGLYSTGVTGVKIEKSATDAWAGEEVEVATIPAPINSYKVTGLTPGAIVYLRVTTYNAKGFGTPTASVSVTTRENYLPSKFERLIMKPNPKITFLVHIGACAVLQSWSLTGGETYTYEAPFDERGIEIETIMENGVELEEQSSIDDVEITPGSWWCDTIGQKVYVHPSGDDDPNNYIYIGKVTFRVTTGRNIVLDNHAYLPFVAAGGIPDISQAISRYYEGNFIISNGSISLINPRINKEHFWDRRAGRFIFLNQPVEILAGGSGFSFSDFVTASTGIITGQRFTDQRAQFTLRDRREGIHRTLPIEKFTGFPNISGNGADKIRPFGYGTIVSAVPVCIDTVNRVFEFHNGRIKTVDAVTQNGVTLTAWTDYFIDYQRGRVTLARGLTYSDDDIILISFKGAVNTADEVIETGADSFRDLMINHLEQADDELDHDSIWRAHLEKTTAISLYVWKETDSQELIRRIERSCQAYSFQTAEGKLGFRVAETTAGSGITYIPNARVLDFSMEKEINAIFSGVDIWYGEDQATDKYQLQQCFNPALTHKYKVKQTLPIYTALTNAADAAALGADIVQMLDKNLIRLSVPRRLFLHTPGDLIYISRLRYYDSVGTANGKLLRIISISKAFSSNKTPITAEEV